jgi:glycosyltransferase involved in cell wall biosynthesis
MQEVEYKNIFYFSNINRIGGVESFFYYLVKKYQDYDIVIFYDTGDINQIQRLKKYVRVKKYNGEHIKCEKAFFNYTFNIINNVEAKEYIQIIHTDYKEQKLSFTPNPKITKYIGVTQIACDSFKEYTGLDCELCYNPIDIEKPKKVLNLISATRLTKEKGKDNIIKFGKLLNEAGIPYLWTIFTDDPKVINNPNIIYMKPRLDIVDYIANADFLCQLSKAGEGFGYTTVESLSVGTPVIVTENKAFLEIGVKDGENGFVLDYELNNVDVKKIYESNLKNKFKYKVPSDNWKKLLVEGENTYKEDLKKIVKVKCKKDYYDLQFNKMMTTKDDPYEVNKIRAEYLEELDLVIIVE